MSDKDKHQEPDLSEESLDDEQNPISDRIQYDIDHREINDFENARDKLQELMDNRNNGKSYGDHADSEYKRVPPKVVGYHRDLGQRPFWFYFLVYAVVVVLILYWGGSLITHEKTLDPATGKMTKVEKQTNGYVTVKDVVKQKDCMMVLLEVKNDQPDPLYVSGSNFTVSDAQGNTYAPDIEKSQTQDDKTSQGMKEGQVAEVMLYYATPYASGMTLHADMTVGYQPISLNLPL